MFDDVKDILGQMKDGKETVERDSNALESKK